MIVAGSGSVGLGQRFIRLIELAYANKIFLGGQHHYTAVGKLLCKQPIEDFASTHAQMGSYGALIGFPLGETTHLCEFAVSDFQPEFKDAIWYCSIGGGQPITDPFLALMREVFWGQGMPTVQDATFAVTWALDHAVKVNPGGINGPVRIAVLEKRKGKFSARLLEDADLQEHLQNIEQAKERLRSFPASQSADAPDTPEVPRP